MRISDWSSDVCSSDLIAQQIIGSPADLAFERPEHVVGHDVQGLRNVVSTAALMLDENRGAIDQDVEIVDRGKAVFVVRSVVDRDFLVGTDIVNRLQTMSIVKG